MPILTRNPDGPYYSEGDERAFFEWATRIRCVQKVGGSGPELQIHVRGQKVSSTCLRELIALCTRYQVPMGQLAQFESAANRKWFKDPTAFWYRAVFVNGKPSNKPYLEPTSRAGRRGKPPARLTPLVEARLRRAGIESRAINAEQQAMHPVVIAPTIDRSVLGVMVDFGRMIPYHLEPGQWDEQSLLRAEETTG